ncbi:PREDICTED: RNA polymerase-associated protein LEO1-like [Acropora digitifera]|uniref:RNA polymerase-associated protein LEO1-like n=1 Tax=Acropora digitifera TaxID=70779 RepID=UPI00077AFF1E|nr:PREDICTED: RNA polymerase-associated protein LEO1-like [Acropora digitifera]
MHTVKKSVFLLILLLGCSLSSSRYIKGSNGRVAERHRSGAEVEDEKDMNYKQEVGKSDDAESNEAEGERRNDVRHSDQEFEEVVNIRPDQSPEDREDQDEGNTDEEERRPGFDDEEMERPDDDSRMMGGNEGDPDDQEVSYDEGIEGFKREADEISKENENMQSQMHDLEAKFDEALS